LGDEYNQLVT